mmetsp:Transcript_12493/g.13875  ORF Transcript_12493/g.13875 Transcript_12493/m.13875 type:complete len:535 (+) Transcript_12493:59-1663(+)
MHLLYICLFVAVAYSATISFSGQLADVSCGDSAGTCDTPPQYTARGTGETAYCDVGNETANWVSITVDVPTAGFYYVAVHTSYHLGEYINVGLYANSMFTCANSCDNLAWALRGSLQGENPTVTTFGAVWIPAGTHLAIVTHDTSIDPPAASADNVGFQGVFVIELTPQKPYEVLAQIDSANPYKRYFDDSCSMEMYSTTFEYTPSMSGNYTLGFTGAVANNTKAIGNRVSDDRVILVPFEAAIFTDYMAPCNCTTSGDCGTLVEARTNTGTPEWTFESGVTYTVVFGQMYADYVAGIVFNEAVTFGPFAPFATLAPTEPGCNDPQRLGTTNYTRINTTEHTITPTCNADGYPGAWNAVPIESTSTGYYLFTPQRTLQTSLCEPITNLVLTLFKDAVAPTAFSDRNFDTLPPDCTDMSFVEAGEDIIMAEFIIADEDWTMVVTAADPTEANEYGTFNWFTVSGQPVGCFPDVPTPPPVDPNTPTEAAPIEPTAPVPPTTTAPVAPTTTGTTPTSPASAQVVVLAVLIALIALLL